MNYLLHCYFNSIKVRLEPYPVGTELILNKFQFHKGAIRTPKVDSRTSVFIGFQFHKGAIRTVLLPYLGKMNIKFQFHKGAIRTIWDIGQVLMFPHFNSIKVRLEQCLAYTSASYRHRFQFHKGAIRTKCASDT